MSPPSTIRLDRRTARIATITFGNAPLNLVVPETMVRLHAIVVELETDPDIQVVVFKSDHPDFFINHFDGAAAGDLPTPRAGEVPMWTDMVVRLSKAPYVSIAAIRGRTRGGGNELAMACDLRYASREKAFFGQPEVGIGIVPGGGGTERLPRLIGRDRAFEAILGSADYDAELAERWGWVTRALPDTELDGFVEAMTVRLASFDRRALAAAKAMVNRATLPPEGDLATAYMQFLESLANPGFQKRAAALGALIAERGLDVEYRLGESLGVVNHSL